VPESAGHYKYNDDLDFVLKSARHVGQGASERGSTYSSGKILFIDRLIQRDNWGTVTGKTVTCSCTVVITGVQIATLS